MNFAAGQHWGVLPVLPGGLPAYGTFMLLAIALGGWLYWRETRRAGAVGEPAMYVFLAALVGGALGAKLPVIFTQRALLTDPQAVAGLLWSGRSIVGGIIGGAGAVALLKWKLKIRERRGNLLVPALAAGLAVGRVGCFLHGCCAGLPTALPWGVDFGDGIARHPTQLYEALLMVGLLFFAWRADGWLRRPGVLFRAFIVLYALQRFVLELLRLPAETWLGLTVYQWLCVFLILRYGPELWRAWRAAALWPQMISAGGEHGGKA